MTNADLVQITNTLWLRGDAIIAIRNPGQEDNYGDEVKTVLVYRGPAGETMKYGFKSYSVEAIADAAVYGGPATKDVVREPKDKVTHDSFPTRDDGEVQDERDPEAPVSVVQRLEQDDVNARVERLRDGLQRRWA